MMEERMSRCSPGSEDSTSPPKPSATDASARSNGTDTAPLFSNEAGPESHGGGILLLTPTTKDYIEKRSTHAAGNLTLQGATGGVSNRDASRHGLTSSSEASPASPPAPQAGARVPQMTAGSGLSSPVSLASWDRAGSSWRTSQVSLLSTEDERFPRSSERWPTSGMTRRGQAFALPTLVRPTAASGSSYLPTVKSTNNENRQSLDRYGMNIGMVLDLLHTPTTGDTVPNYDHRASPGYTRAKPVPNLHAQIDELLPTPKTPTGGSEAREAREARGSGGEDLEARLRSLGEPTNPPSEGGKP